MLKLLVNYRTLNKNANPQPLTCNPGEYSIELLAVMGSGPIKSVGVCMGTLKKAMSRFEYEPLSKPAVLHCDPQNGSLRIHAD